MIFDEGNIIFRNGNRYLIAVRQDVCVFLEDQIGEKIHKVKISDLVDEYIEGIVHIEGYDSPMNQQAHISEKEWCKIQHRKIFALAFDNKNVSKEQAKKKIRRIGRLLNMPPKNHPSRATCYRWAKLLRDARGDITVLS